MPRGRDALDQEPRELGAVRDEIVRPFQPDVRAAEIPDGATQRDAGDEPDLWRNLGFARAEDQRARMQVSRGRSPDAPVTAAARRLFVGPNPEISGIVRQRALPRFVAGGAQARVALDPPAVEREVREFGLAIGSVQNSDFAAAIAALVSGAGARA